MLQDVAKDQPWDGSFHSVLVSWPSNMLHSSSDLLHILFTFWQVVDSKDQARLWSKLHHPLTISFSPLNYSLERVVHPKQALFCTRSCGCQQRNSEQDDNPLSTYHLDCTSGGNSGGTLRKSLGLWGQLHMIQWTSHYRVDVFHLIPAFELQLKMEHKEEERRTTDKWKELHLEWSISEVQCPVLFIQIF